MAVLSALRLRILSPLFNLQTKPTLLKECKDANLDGFPTWDFQGERIKGDKEISLLRRKLNYKLGIAQEEPEERLEEAKGQFSEVK